MPNDEAVPKLFDVLTQEGRIRQGRNGTATMGIPRCSRVVLTDDVLRAECPEYWTGGWKLKREQNKAPAGFSFDLRKKRLRLPF